MSDFSVVSPPPTSGSLTVVDRANLSQSYAGGGGGGGSIGPDPSVSSLTVNFKGGVQSRFSTLSNGVSGSAEVNFDHDDVPTVTTTLVYDGKDGISSLSVYTKAGGYFNGTLNVAELKGVSSINGAVPGGGGSGPNPSFSTLTVANSLSIFGSSPLDGSVLSMSQLSPNGVLFNYTSSATTFAQIEMVRSVNSGPNGGVKMNGGQDGTTISVGNSQVVITSDGGTNANSITLAETKGGNVSISAGATIALQAPSIITAVSGTNLQISSINGQLPALANPSTFVSTVGLITITPVTSSILTDMPVGLCAYSFLGDNTTSDVTVAGMMNVTVDPYGNTYASFTNFNGGPNSNLIFPYIDKSNTADPKFGIANTSPFLMNFTGTLSRIL